MIDYVIGECVSCETVKRYKIGKKKKEQAVDKKIPAKGRVIVRKVSNEKTRASGLIVVESDISPTEKAEILAVGECNNKFAVGDYCYFQRGGCIDIGLGEFVCVENEILYSESKE